MVVFLTGICPIISGIFQYIYPYIPCQTIGYLFIGGIIHIFIVSKVPVDVANDKNNELYAILLSMTDEYETLLTLDLDSCEEHMLRNRNSFFSGYVNLENADYEKRIRFFAENYVISSGREDFIKKMQLSEIMKNTANMKPYFVIYQILHDGNLHWYESKFVNSSTSALKHSCVIGIRCIDVEMANEYKIRNEIEMGKKKVEEQLEILTSVSSIYSYMNLLSFADKTIIRFDSEEQRIENFSFPQTFQSNLNVILNSQITESQKEDFFNFTNLQTLNARMEEKKVITHEFLNTISGWFRAQYILVNRSSSGSIDKIIYTVQNIDEEKKREQQIIHSSEIDELTGLLNRKAYERYIFELSKEQIPENFVYASLDVNGLKEINDSQGHEAGDELLKAATFAMTKCFGSFGSVFRVGGDEFVALFYADSKELNAIKSDLKNTLLNYKNDKIGELSIAAGYVCRKEFPDMPLNYISNLADKRMYKSKNSYYENKGIDRRGLQVAYSVLCNTYVRIMKVDLLKDSYTIIRMDENEGVSLEKCDETFSELIGNYEKSGSIHPDDCEKFRKCTSIENLSEVFNSKNSHLLITYRRKLKDSYKSAYMEMVPAKEFTTKHKIVYLYVKYIDAENNGA